MILLLLVLTTSCRHLSQPQFILWKLFNFPCLLGSWAPGLAQGCKYPSVFRGPSEQKANERAEMGRRGARPLDVLLGLQLLGEEGLLFPVR